MQNYKYFRKQKKKIPFQPRFSLKKVRFLLELTVPPLKLFFTIIIFFVTLRFGYKPHLNTIHRFNN